MRNKNLKIPISLKPLLWGLRWRDLDAWQDRADIVLAVLNEGELEHIRWIKENYGLREIKKILSVRLETELHPESRNLARVIFSIPSFQSSRRQTINVRNT